MFRVIFDPERVNPRIPELTYDLPAGARRLKQKADGIMATVVNYDVLYIGGGNARHIKAWLPSNVQLVANSAGITGGVRLWDARLDETFSERPPFASS